MLPFPEVQIENVRFFFKKFLLRARIKSRFTLTLRRCSASLGSHSSPLRYASSSSSDGANSWHDTSGHRSHLTLLPSATLRSHLCHRVHFKQDYTHKKSPLDLSAWKFRRHVISNKLSSMLFWSIIILQREKTNLEKEIDNCVIWSPSK